MTFKTSSPLLPKLTMKLTEILIGLFTWKSSRVPRLDSFCQLFEPSNLTEGVTYRAIAVYEHKILLVLGALLFILFITDLSTVTADSSVYHTLYADDTGLFLFFSAIDFAHNILLLEYTSFNVCNWSLSKLSFSQSLQHWISFLAFLSNLLDSVFLLVLYSDNVTMSLVSAVRNLGIILAITKTFSDHNFSLSRPCLCKLCDSGCIRMWLPKAFSTATSSVHSKLDHRSYLLVHLSWIVFTLLYSLPAVSAVNETRGIQHSSDWK